MAEDRPLTVKQEAFAEGILQGLSGVQAAMKAGYKGNSNVLAQIAHKTVRNGKGKGEIDRRMAELEAETDYNVSKWLSTTIDDCKRAAKAGQWGAVASFKRLLAQYTGALEADRKQGRTQLQLNISNQQALIDEAIALGKALDEAPDALAR